MDTDTDSVAHRFAEAFNARNIDELVKVFTPDVAYHDLFYGKFSGSNGLRGLFGRMFAEGSRHEWTMNTVVRGGDCTIGEWRFAFTISAAVRTGAGRTLRFNGVSVFETRDGRCHTYREYFDRTAALLAVGVAPASVAGIVARRPTIEVSLPELGTLSR
jgi:ketosteroid isomerase-like protein